MNEVADIDTETLAEYFEFLDDLRASGATNMFGAGSYLVDAFDMDRRQYRAVLKAWMDTFDGDKSASDRAAIAKAAA